MTQECKCLKVHGDSCDDTCKFEGFCFCQPQPTTDEWGWKELDEFLEPPKYHPILDKKDCFVCGHPVPDGEGMKKLKALIVKHFVPRSELVAEGERMKPTNKKKPYDGNNLKSAGDYYGIHAESWAEIIRYEDGQNAALNDLISKFK